VLELPTPLPPILVPLFLGVLELFSRIAVLSARPPVLSSRFMRPRAGRRACHVASMALRFLRRCPQLAASEPFHFRIGLFRFDPVKRRQELVLFGGAKSSRQPAREDCPIGMSWWHFSFTRQESGIRNQESGIRAVSGFRDQGSGIRDQGCLRLQGSGLRAFSAKSVPECSRNFCKAYRADAPKRLLF
jgi:hypothetical protein